MTARTCEWHDMPIPCKACDTSTVTNLIFGPAATRNLRISEQRIASHSHDGATPDLAATRMQPEPVKTESVPVVHYVINDILARADVGLDRYGTMLKADNGRDHLVDAYQEALDLACYLRAELIRRDGK